MDPDRKPTTWIEGGVTYYTASAVGSCPRALVAARRGEFAIPPSDAAEARMAAGWDQEAYVLDRLADMGWKIEHTGRESQYEFTVWVVENRIAIVGHPDGIATFVSTGERRTLEIKSASPDAMKPWRKVAPAYTLALAANDRYAGQFTAAMMGTGLPGLYAVKERPTPAEIDDGRDPRDGELITFLVDSPPMSWETLREKLVMVEIMATQSDVEWPPCPISGPERFFCNYPQLHDADPIEELPELADLFRWAHQIQVERDELDDELKTVKKQLRSAIEEHEIRHAKSAGVTVLLKDFVTTRNDIDGMKARLRELGEDVGQWESQPPVQQVVIGKRLEGEARPTRSRAKKGDGDAVSASGE